MIAVRAFVVALAPAAAPSTATDIDVAAGKTQLVSLARVPTRLFIAEAGIATASAGGRTIFVTGRAAGETGWVASNATGCIIDTGVVRVRYDEAALAAALPASAIAISTARDVLILSGSVASAAEGDDAMRLAAR